MVVIQPLSRVWLFRIPQTAAHQASLSITNSQTLLKLMSIESVMASNHLILCRPLLLLPQSFPASGSFPVISSSHLVAKVLEGQLQHQSFQWTFRVDFPLNWVWISVVRDLLKGLQSWAPSIGEIIWSASPSGQKIPLQTRSGSLC